MKISARRIPIGRWVSHESYENTVRHGVPSKHQLQLRSFPFFQRCTRGGARVLHRRFATVLRRRPASSSLLSKTVRLKTRENTPWATFSSAALSYLPDGARPCATWAFFSSPSSSFLSGTSPVALYWHDMGRSIWQTPDFFLETPTAFSPIRISRLNLDAFEPAKSSSRNRKRRRPNFKRISHEMKFRLIDVS